MNKTHKQLDAARAARIAAEAVSTEDLQRMVKIANRVWQYIGSDFMDGSDEFDNEAAVECCFDADRPLTCTNGGKEARAEAETDNLFMKMMYKRYTFNVCVRTVTKEVRYV